jgi:hypothetical protein
MRATQQPGPEAAELKGVSFLNARPFVVERFGEPMFQRMLEAVGPQVAPVFRSPFGHEWYPLRHMAEWDAKLAELCFGGDVSRVAEWGAYDAKIQVGTVYRFLFRLLEPRFVIAKADRLLANSVRPATVAVTLTGEASAQVRLSGFSPHHLAFCHDWRGTLAGILELVGSKRAIVEHGACRLDGAPACVYNLSW